MARLANTPEDLAQPGDRIADLVIREAKSNPYANSVDKYYAKLGEPYDALLVLQGGALRTIYSAGVLDTFLDAGIAFKDVAGISGGALMGLDYCIGARGAAAYLNIVYCGDSRYMGLRDLIAEQSIFSFDFMFGEVADYLMPIDYERFFASPMNLTTIASCCESAQPAYFDLSKPGLTAEDVAAACSASCSLPLLSKPVIIDDRPYLDGGCTDPIGLGPAYEAIEQGRKVVFVSTRQRGYQKGEMSANIKRTYRTLYRRWPAFVETLCEMNELYNRQSEEIDALAAKGQAFVIHPIIPPEVSRTEDDPAKLHKLYEQGIYEGLCALPALKAYLEG